jgi:ribosomal protein S18 acetylase RimI-like enzyme
MDALRIRRLTPTDAAQYRAVMLQAYACEPDAFTSTVAEREPLPLPWWAARISDLPDPRELVVGAFMDEPLVGLAGLMFEDRERTAHKARLFGMFVLPEFRGRGVGHALVREVLVLARSRPATRVVQLTVTASNAPAVRLYESSGFVPFGNEPFAIKIGERFVSKLHMWCAVEAPSATRSHGD